MASGLLNFVGFNQDGGCFSCGTNSGFRVYNCDPFKETFCRGFDNGGIGIVEMLFRCNILAIVGGGPSPRYPPSKVMIWDDHQGRCIGELSFRSQVRAVRLRRDRVVVCLELKVLVYNFADLKLLHQIETLPNPKGLVALSSAAESTVLACPGLHPGQIRIELYDRRQTKFITAHTNALSCLALSLDGKRLASASDKGTLIRVWNTTDGQLLQELRRGADPACIHSLALSRGCEWLAASSDKGTVHVFALSEAVQAGIALLQGAATGAPAGAQLPGSGSPVTSTTGAATATPPANGQPGATTNGTATNGSEDGSGQQGPGMSGGGSAATPPRSNPTSLLSLVKGLVPSIALPKYFASEWSWAQFRVPGGEEGGRSVLGFGAQSNVLYIITSGGSFYKVSFDTTKGGPCTQDAFTRFIEPSSGV